MSLKEEWLFREIEAMAVILWFLKIKMAIDSILMLT